MAPFFVETVPNAGLEIEDIFEMDAEGGGERGRNIETEGEKTSVSGRSGWL